MGHKKKNKKFVLIDARFGNYRRFLGDRVHPGLSAAVSWCEKHYPAESADIDKNFTFRCIGHDKLLNIFLEELGQRITCESDRCLLLSMAKSLISGGGIRVLTSAEKKLRKHKEPSVHDKRKASDKKKQKPEKQDRAEASKAFRRLNSLGWRG